MKRLDLILLAAGWCGALTAAAQQKPALSLNLSYFNDNGRVQYLVANAKTKVNGKFRPRDSVAVRFYIGDSTGNLLGKAITNHRGEAALFIPPAAKEQWERSPKQSFLVRADPSPASEAGTATVEITKAKIELDTAADKGIVATVLEQNATGWEPVKGVDVILAVKRMGSNLNVTRTPTYTTDSAGKASADFKLEDLPGDDSGNIVLIARLDANDAYGTITREKKVPWGVARLSPSDFNKRTLYARRGLAPGWLGFMAYSISLAVWGVIIYLFFQLRKLRKIGAQYRRSPK